MIPAPFDYERVTTVEEAIRWLQDDPDAKLVAGGHSLIPLMKLRLARPSRLVDISRLPELRTVDVEAGKVAIGAGVRYHELADNRRLADVMPIIGQVTRVIADPQVRHRGTIGGSAVHADPGSDLAALFLATDAIFHVQGAGGARDIAAADWYMGALMAALGPDDVLTRVTFRRPLPSRQTYVKLPHPASGYALAGVVALADVDASGRIDSPRIGVTGAAVLPFRARSAERALQGQPLNQQTISEAAKAGADEGEYADDPLYSGEYRHQMAQVMISRALQKLLVG